MRVSPLGVTLTNLPDPTHAPLQNPVQSPLLSEVFLVPRRICLSRALRPDVPSFTTSFLCPGLWAWLSCLYSGLRTDRSLLYIPAPSRGGQAEWVLRSQQEKLARALALCSDRELTTTQGQCTGAQHYPGSFWGQAGAHSRLSAACPPCAYFQSMSHDPEWARGG